MCIRDRLHPGLYEQVINNALTCELAEIPEARKSVAPIDKAEASKVLAQYLADVVQKGLDNVLDNGGDISDVYKRQHININCGRITNISKLDCKSQLHTGIVRGIPSRSA